MDRERGDETPYGEPMKVPEHMDSTDLAPDDPYRFGIRFECSVCGKKFSLRPEDYDGRWDHPPGEPICRECEEMCETCGGTGEVHGWLGNMEGEAECADCGGTGRVAV